MNILNFLKKYDSFKHYIADDTVKGYNLIFTLLDGTEISFSTTVEEFNIIRKWYENKDEINYSIGNTCRSQTALISGKYVNLSKSNIVEFSYSAIINRDSILNTIMYIITAPESQTMNVFGYIKGLFLAPIFLVVYIIYEKCILNITLKNILNNTKILNQIVSISISVVTIMFVLWYVISFTLKILTLKPSKNYFYELRNQKIKPICNYAIFNFAVICFIAFALSLCKFF